MNKINPIFDAMSGIDNDIVSGALEKERKHPKYFEPMMIAAAAAVLCAATAVTAIATIKPPAEVTMNQQPVDVEYDVYIDENGREIRTYTCSIPEYALLEEVPGCTAVGKVKAICRGDRDWVLIDEEGTVFTEGVNNLEVFSEAVDEKRHMLIGFRCANFNEEDYYSSLNRMCEKLDHSDARIDFSVIARDNNKES